jgi:hypothetical protein
MGRAFDFDAYEERCKVTKEIVDFLKENPMSYIAFIRYARENNKEDWQSAIRSRGCGWIRRYCLDGKYLIKKRNY